ncbi:MAG: hypothetical protein DMG06_23355 [Acidobacteria bacterium]|nr:MAG: hypothetical protein DMG06_23355 [Acidobacteriota bacterium]
MEPAKGVNFSFGSIGTKTREMTWSYSGFTLFFRVFKQSIMLLAILINVRIRKNRKFPNSR